MTNAAELPLSAQRVIEAVETIEPLDEIEKTHKADTLAWVRSAAPIFRVAKRISLHDISYRTLWLSMPSNDHSCWSII